MEFSYVALLLFLLLEKGQSSGVDDIPKAQSLQSDTTARCDFSIWKQEPTKKDDVAFRLRMETNLVRYAPEKKYLVFLEAAMNNSRFTKFMLTVDSLNNSDPGMFELQNNVLTTFSSECRNTIIQTSFIPKTAISVIWKAPAVDSGFVRIRGAAYDTAHQLHHSGNMTLELRQGELDETVLPAILDVCRACNEASYQLQFEGLWSRQTHPKEFPQNLFETSFEGVIGASHANDFRLWELRKNASDGIAELAETGNTKALESELKSQSEQIRTLIKTKGLAHPNLNDKTYAIFRTDDKNHLVSLIAKFNPSPDWVVGISALELCLSNNSWAISRVVNLFPIDVGNIEGATYRSPKVPTIPRAAIRHISSTENPDSPFYSEAGVIQPMAKVTIHRQRVFGKTKCITSGSNFNDYECAVTDWMNEGPCNCRTWKQKRRRNYKNYNDKHNERCKEPLTDEIACTCNGYGDSSSNHPTLSTDYPMSCDTTEWSSWTECTCRNTYRSRRRYYKNSVSRQGCTEHRLWQKEDCLHTPPCDPLTNGRCAVTEWSEWSPCNATCEMTMGMRLRTRLFLSPMVNISGCSVHTFESEPCHSDKTDCNGAAMDICFETKDAGPCRGDFVRWYYNKHEGRCLKFVYGGCRGNKNNFKSFPECHKTCDGALREHSYNIPNPLTPDDPNLVVDCKLSQWADWSECSSTCGNSWKDKRRTVEINAQNGGKPCDKKLYQRKRCKSLPPCGEVFKRSRLIV